MSVLVRGTRNPGSYHLGHFEEAPTPPSGPPPVVGRGGSDRGWRNPWATKGQIHVSQLPRGSGSYSSNPSCGGGVLILPTTGPLPSRASEGRMSGVAVCVRVVGACAKYSCSLHRRREARLRKIIFPSPPCFFLFIYSPRVFLVCVTAPRRGPRPGRRTFGTGVPARPVQSTPPLPHSPSATAAGTGPELKPQNRARDRRARGAGRAGVVVDPRVPGGAVPTGGEGPAGVSLGTSGIRVPPSLTWSGPSTPGFPGCRARGGICTRTLGVDPQGRGGTTGCGEATDGGEGVVPTRGARPVFGPSGRYPTSPKP